MVLQVAYKLLSAILPSQYYLHAFTALFALIVIYAFAQGRTTTRERDLHARVILVTGAFTPMGLTLISALAGRGAHIIALSSYPITHTLPSLLIPLLRTTTKNESIYAEQADMSDLESVRSFCTRFLTGQDQRLDAIVFAHEYTSKGRLFGFGKQLDRVSAEKEREAESLASFLMLTLLLPALLVAPVERDIRVISVVNPFYAAAIPAFTSSLLKPSSAPSSVLLLEGHRALRTAVLTRHLQRILDSLPNAKPDASPPQGSSSEAPKPPTHPAPSNILAVSVCPGISRQDTVSPLLGAERNSESGSSLFGFILYTLLFPILFITTKSSKAAIESVLHVLFLPTPLKRALAQVSAAASGEPTAPAGPGRDANALPEEVLKPGALYRECAVVKVDVPSLPSPALGEKTKNAENGKATSHSETAPDEGMSVIPDDGEFGGEAVGRAVWEWYEERLKVWEASAEKKVKADGKTSKADATPNAEDGASQEEGEVRPQESESKST